MCLSLIFLCSKTYIFRNNCGVKIFLLFCICNCNQQVEEAEKDLQDWLSSTKIHRKQCKWLAFFSNKKLLQVHHLLTKDFFMHAEHIVQEISIIFPNDYPTRASQVTFVKVC